MVVGKPFPILISATPPIGGGGNNNKGHWPARIALWTKKSLPPTDRVTSLNFWFSNRQPRSSESLHSGTLNWTAFDWPEIFTLSATTLTCESAKIRNSVIASKLISDLTLIYGTLTLIINGQKWNNTSQNIVNLSSGSNPFASSKRKSLRINFLNPQSFPWTNLYALWLSVDKKKKINLKKNHKSWKNYDTFPGNIHKISPRIIKVSWKLQGYQDISNNFS